MGEKKLSALCRMVLNNSDKNLLYQGRIKSNLATCLFLEKGRIKITNLVIVFPYYSNINEKTIHKYKNISKQQTAFYHKFDFSS